MEVINTPVSPYIQNAPIAYCPSTLESIYVDPGDEIEKLVNVSNELDLKPQYIFITHGHIDHAGAAAELARELNLEIIGPHIEDKFLLDVLEIQGQMYGMKAENFTPSKWLTHNDSISFGNQKLEILLCPGHTPGHIIAVNHQAKKVIGGDVLFNGSIGRTDLPGGNFELLIESVKNKLWPLGNDIEFIPGHGPVSTFSVERASNPFVSDNVLGLS